MYFWDKELLRREERHLMRMFSRNEAWTLCHLLVLTRSFFFFYLLWHTFVFTCHHRGQRSSGRQEKAAGNTECRVISPLEKLRAVSLQIKVQSHQSYTTTRCTELMQMFSGCGSKLLYRAETVVFNCETNQWYSSQKSASILRWQNMFKRLKLTTKPTTTSQPTDPS